MSPLNYIPDLQVDLSYPRDGQHLSREDLRPEPRVAYAVSLTPGMHGLETSAGEFSVAAIEDGAEVCFALDGEGEVCGLYGASSTTIALPKDLGPGWHRLGVWVRNGEGDRIGGCKDVEEVRFKVVESSSGPLCEVRAYEIRTVNASRLTTFIA